MGSQHLEQQEMELDSLSIINPDPIRLHGPDLLHDLVKPPCDLVAIEYLEHGTRTSLTYRDLHEKSEAIARRISHFIKDNSDGFVVPVLIPQCPLLYISLLGILKAGGAFCPLNLDAPLERVKFILEDVSAQITLVSKDFASRIPASTGIKIVVVDEPEEDNHGAIQHRRPTTEDLAYVMYTSGSTGTPKGVALSHSAATQALLAHDRHIPIFSRFLQFAAPTFDVFVFEAFFPLMRGSTLISVLRGDLLNDLPRVIRDMEVDACELTPTVAGSLLRKRQNVPKLKLLLTIGEMLKTSVVEEFGGDKTRQSMLWAMYGPTEATIHCTLQPAFRSDGSTGLIGVPLDTTSCFVIQPTTSTDSTAEFRILPKGEIGELAVGGHQLAEGYLNRPQQTAAAFISSPYGRIYRTGDKARLSADGTLECLGRLADGQVKLRGQRIELGEIEGAILRTDGCHNAVAAVVDSTLIAFCAVDSAVNEDAILAQCRKWLPQYMVPAQCIVMHDLPRLPSGKVDKKKLQIDFQKQKQSESSKTSSASFSETEELVMQAVAEVVGTAVDLQTTLASAGIDSLTSIKLASTIRDRGLDVTASQILTSKSFKQLCSAVQNPTSDPSSYVANDISLMPDLDSMMHDIPSLKTISHRITDILPCTPLQSAILVQTLSNPELYCNEIELEANQSISIPALSEAFRRLALENEILRSAFISWQGDFKTIILDSSQEEQIKLVTDFDYGFKLGDSDAFLQLWRVQIRRETSDGPIRVLLQLHHAVYDGWSLDLMLHDLSAILSGKQLSNRPQFRDVIKFQANQARSRMDDSSAGFWTEYLLHWSKQPFPKLNPGPRTSQKAMTMRRPIALDPMMVRERSAVAGISSQTLFQAAVALVWSRILMEPDIVIGSVTSGRSIPVNGIDQVLGPCIASLPLRVNFEQMTHVHDLLGSIHSSNRSIMEHCTLPLSKIMKLVDCGDTLYDVLFVYQESIASRSKAGNLIKEVHHIDRLETKILVEVEPKEDEFDIQLTYHARFVTEEFMECFLAQIKSTVQQLLHHQSESLAELSANKVDGLSIYNPQPQAYNGVPDLAKHFQLVATQKPEDDALSFATSLTDSKGMKTMTFRMLNEQSNQIAHFIQSNQILPGHVVAIIMEKSIELYASILAIVKAGCAYLPITPSTPVARIRDILGQADAHFCLTDQESRQIIGSIEDVMTFTVDLAAMENFSKESLDIQADPSRLAYVIYTSGTTGVPKGVAVTQLNIVSNIQHLIATYPINKGKQSRLLQACSQAFDVSVFEIFFTWLSGMCLCAATNDVLFSDLEHAIRTFNITHLSLTPTVASLIQRVNVPGVEFLVTAGEPMTQAVLDTWGDLLWQGYGPSETTNICSVKRMSPNEHIEHLGWVFPNTSVFVMRPGSLEPLPYGWVGEFCFGGDQVVKGYLNMPSTTAEKFIEHHLFGRIYRSGDLGRMLPDGSLVILGRIDTQIKLRGHRIETTEIDSLMTSTGLANAAVTMIVSRQEYLNEQLATFYVPMGCEEKEVFDTTEVNRGVTNRLFSTLRSHLPSYMVPSYIIPLSSIPLTPTGKIDRRRLSTMFREKSQEYLESASNGVSGSTDNSEWSSGEKQLAEVIATTLLIETSQIGRWTPFATIGLDSITAMRVSRAISSKIGKKLPVSAVLRNPNVALLSRYLGSTEEDHEQSSFSKKPPLLPEEVVTSTLKLHTDKGQAVDKILPCTPLQEAMLSHDGGAYMNKVLMRIHTSPDNMKAYWDTMCHRHDILRTCFASTDSTTHAIVQVVLREWQIVWKTFQSSESSLDEMISEHVNSMPDPLNSGTPPISFAILDHRGSIFLSLVCHHSLYDGVAMENMWREVECLAKDLPLDLPVHYEPFLREVFELPSDWKDFWSRQLLEFRPFLLSSTSNQIDQSATSDSVSIPLHKILSKSRDLGVSLLAVCQAAWTSVLASCQDSQDVCFGNVVSGRTLDVDGIEKLVAPCFNTIPIRVDLSSITQNQELVKRLFRLNQEVMPYQFTPLRSILRNSNIRSRRLFDTMVLLQQPPYELDETIWKIERDSGDMDVPIVCEVTPHPASDILKVRIHSDLAIVPEDSATELLNLFISFFERILATPYADPVDHSLLSTRLRKPALQWDSQADGNIEDHTMTSNESWSHEETAVRAVLSTLSEQHESTIQRNTTIFKLGLDSINAVQIASILRQSGFSISASDVIELATCEKIGQRLQNRDGTALSTKPTYDLHRFSEEVSAQIEAGLTSYGGIEAVIPCTSMQSAIYSSFVQSEGHNYLNLISYEVDSSIEVSGLVQAWSLLQQQHPMLRTMLVPVQHRDTSYAMVRYEPSATALPLDVFEEIEDAHQTVSDWEQASKIGILQGIAVPWRVAVVANKRQLSMHILVHHAIYDTRSMEDILNSLALIVRGNRPPTFEAVEPGLATIMANAQTTEKEAEEYWKQQAANLVVNHFPVLTPLREDERIIMVESLPSCLTLSELQKSTKQLEISMQAAIQAAWTRVLAVYLGESSVVFGVTLSGRTTDDTQNAPFPCINTVPIITKNVASNLETLRAAMEHMSVLHKYQFSPLNRVQKWLGHPANSIFDTLLAFQKVESFDEALSPWRLIQDEPRTEYPVSLEVLPDNSNHMHLRLTFLSNIVPREQAQILLKQFDSILQHLVQKPNEVEDDLYKAMPELFSITPAPTPVLPSPVAYLHDFVDRGALLHPDKIAFEFVHGFEGETPISQTWSYRELNEIGNRMAHMLLKRVRPRSIVAIHFEKSPEAYFSILGILKAGCSFVALDTNAPGARKEFILSDSQSPCILIKKGMKLEFELPCEVLEISEEDLDEYPITNPSADICTTPQSTCYCLYTSGTTGTPKGCEITHENAVQAMMAFQELFQGHWDEDSRCLQFASLHFDVSVLEQYWSWSVGIRVISASKDLILDDLTASINRLGITHIDLTPSLARLVHPDEVPSLCRGVFITGGEQLKQEILDIWGPKAVIYNAYGPTEATIGVTMYQRVPINGRPSNIGKQFSNVGTYVFREGTEIPVLRGGVGELCVSGKLVGKGYLNRPQLTEDRFPTLSYFGERIYRTGDLVRILHDGCLDFLGRADDQVKLRGQRLEIGEINHVIRSRVPAIEDVATIVTRHESVGNDVLVTFIVGEERRQDHLQVIPDEGLVDLAKAACRAYLPKYMEPTYFLRLPFIPLSPNNKAELKILKSLFNSITREELLKLTATKTGSSESIDSEVFRTVTLVLSSFSSSSPADIHEDTNIFDLGIDSITALQFAKLLRDKGFKNASTTVILRNPIVAELTRALTTAKSQNQTGFIREAEQYIYATSHRYRGFVCRELSIQANDIEYIAPCSPLQQGMVSKAITTETGAYFNTFKLILNDDASIERLKQSWERLVSSQAILRTRFVNTTDGSLQVALKHPGLFWQDLWVEATDSVDEKLAIERQKWVDRNKTHIVNPFHIIHVQGHAQRLLAVHIFHGLYDGNSFNLLLDSLASQYNGLQDSDTPKFIDALKHGPLWKHDYCKSFWINHLSQWSPSPVTKLSELSNSPAVTATLTLPLQELENIRKTYGVTLQSIAMAGWISVLRKLVSAEPTVGIIVSGRSIERFEADAVVGPMFNTLPLFCGELATTDWASLINGCHNFNTSVLQFQHVALQTVQKWCSNGKPLFDILFAFQIEQQQSHDDVPWKVEDGQSVPDYPLALEVVHKRNGEVAFTVVAQGHLANQFKVDEISSALQEAYTSMSSDSALPVTNIGGEHEQISEQDGSSGSPTHSEEFSDNFEWFEEADTLYEEISTLSGLNMAGVSSSTTMTELGLDSIDIIKLSSRLKKKGIEIPASLIMREQSISRICQAIQRKDTVTEPSNEGHLRALKESLWNQVASTGADMSQIETILPPTALQESMVASMLESNFEWYFNHDVLELDKDVDLARLQDAWRRVVEESQILRTGFYEVNAPELDMAYCQVVSKESASIAQLQHGTENAVQIAIDEAKREARKHGGKRNLFQVRFINNGPQRLAVVSIAHALYDGWSLNLMYEALEAAYEGLALVTRTPNAFISHSLSSRTDDARGFWEDYLEGATPTKLSENDTQLSGPLMLHRREGSTTTAISVVSSFCRSQSISLQTLCQACWALVLAHTTRKLDVIFGVVLSGRDINGAEDLMFPTINTIALRSILHGNVSSFLAYLEENMADIRQFQAFPLRKAQLAAKVSGQDLFNTLFMLQKSHSRTSQKRLMTSVDGGVATLDYPVCVEAEAYEDALVWRVACQSSIMTGEQAEALIDRLNQTMDFMLASPTAELLSWSEDGVSIAGQSRLAISMEHENAAEGYQHGQPGEWNDIARTIREVLSQISGVEENLIGLSTSLYELGLDSITAIKVSLSLRDRHVLLKPRDLIKAQDVHRMALAAQGAQATTEQDTSDEQWQPPKEIDVTSLLSDHGIVKEDVEAVLPALPSQVYMLGVWQNTDGAVYFPEFAYRLDGSFMREELENAWDKLIEETPMLRTRFIPTASRRVPMMQVILKPGSVVLTTASTRLVHLQAQPEDGSRGWQLSLRLHHALYDGVSLPSLMDSFAQILKGGQLGPNGLAAWAKYCISTTTVLDGDCENQLSHIMDYKVLTPWESTGLLSAASSDRVSYLKKAAVPDTSSMRQCARMWQVSVQSVFLAAYATALCQSSGHDQASCSLMFGLYLANRTDNADLRATYPTLKLAPLCLTCEPAQPRQTALHIQQRLSNQSVLDTRLWDVKARAGSQLTSFVNFLSLPDAEAESPSQIGNKSLAIVPQTLQVTDDDSACAALGWRGVVGEVPVKNELPEAIDVEVSIQHDGSLDIGVFGPRRCISEEGAVALVSHIAAAIGSMSASPVAREA